MLHYAGNGRDLSEEIVLVLFSFELVKYFSKLLSHSGVISRFFLVRWVSSPLFFHIQRTNPFVGGWLIPFFGEIKCFWGIERGIRYGVHVK